MKTYHVIRQGRVTEESIVEMPEDADDDDIVEAAWEKGFKVVKRSVEDTWIE